MIGLLTEFASSLLICVLTAAAIHKLVQRHRLAVATSSLLGVGLPVGSVLSLAAAACEGLAAVAILSPAGRVAGAMLAAGLWVVYATALAVARLRGGAPFDCGCSFGTRARPIDALSLGRPLLLAAVAILVATSPAEPSSIGIFTAFAALAFFSLFWAAGELAALPSPKRRQVR